MDRNRPARLPSWQVTFTYRTAEGSTGKQHVTVRADGPSHARALAWAQTQTPDALRHRRGAGIPLRQRLTAAARRIPGSEQ